MLKFILYLCVWCAFRCSFVFQLQIAKNNGCVTVAHFGRVLYFLKINLSVDDFQLLVSKFLKDGYTVNYMAFLAALEYIYECMEENGITDINGVSTDMRSLFMLADQYGASFVFSIILHLFTLSAHLRQSIVCHHLHTFYFIARLRDVVINSYITSMLFLLRSI